MDYFNLHTHKSTHSPEIVELVNQYPDEFDETIPFYSIGIHPWRILEAKIDEQMQFIERKLQSKNGAAIGECGLDKRIEIDLKLQSEVFERQLLLAEKLQKPVIIHCVAAFQEVIQIKKKLRITVPMLIHGFSKNAQVAESLVKNGFYISFGKYLLRNPELESVFKSVPDDKFFLETDTIEDGIQDVYNVAANYKNKSESELKAILNRNFNTVFHHNSQF